MDNPIITFRNSTDEILTAYKKYGSYLTINSDGSDFIHSRDINKYVMIEHMNDDFLKNSISYNKELITIFPNDEKQIERCELFIYIYTDVLIKRRINKIKDIKENING